MAVDVQELVGQGYWPCPTCRGLNRPKRDQCAFCTAPRPAPDTPPAPMRVTSPRRKKTAPSNQQASRGRVAGLGGFAAMPDGYVDIVVFGEPIGEGSTRMTRDGKIIADDSRLGPWRRLVAAEARKVCGPDWTAVNAPVHVSAVFTIPPLDGLPKTKPVPADSWRDKDKLMRAIGDALSPSRGWRMLASDMRIAGEAIPGAKTYPRPLHTHPCALDRPGVWIRVQLADTYQPVCVDGLWQLRCPVPSPDTAPVSTPLTRLELPPTRGAGPQ